MIVIIANPTVFGDRLCSYPVAISDLERDPGMTYDLSCGPVGMNPGYNPAYMAQQQGQPNQLMSQGNPNSKCSRNVDYLRRRDLQL